MIINQFRQEYSFLSNFYPSPIKYGGYMYPTVEHLFQALKTHDENIRYKIRQAFGPAKAKKIGRSIALRSDWEEVKDQLMEDIVCLKFSQNPLLKAQLLATGNVELIEGNTWNDIYWGVNLKTGKGLNKLGKILELVRSCLQ